MLDDAGQVASHSDGLVAGWLDDTASDYVDAAGNAAALWHVTLETGELAGDEEDLELHEVLESLVPLEAAPLRPPAGAPVDDDETEDEDEAAPAPPPKQPLKRGPTKRKAQAKKPGGADASLFPERAERPSGGDRRRGTPHLLLVGDPLCRKQPVDRPVRRKLQTSRARSHRSRFG